MKSLNPKKIALVSFTLFASSAFAGGLQSVKGTYHGNSVYNLCTVEIGRRLDLDTISITTVNGGRLGSVITGKQVVATQDSDGNTVFDFTIADDLVKSPDHFHVRARGRKLLDVGASNADKWQNHNQGNQICMNLVKQ